MASQQGLYISVMTRDGGIRWRKVEGDELSIGSTRDNDLVLAGTGISPHHARAHFAGGRCTVTDLNSATGTFLANVQLLPGVPQAWGLHQALRIGDVWLRLEQMREAGAADSVAGPEDTSARDTHDEAVDLAAVIVATPEITVEPGGRGTLVLTILNQGTVVDHFQVTVGGLPSEWVPALPPIVRLLPGAQHEVSLAVQPPRSPQARAGRYSLTVRVASRDRPERVVEAGAQLTLLPFQEFDVDLRPRRQSGLIAGSYRVLVGNQGNAGLSVELQAVDPEEACRFAFDPPKVTVPPGEQRSVHLAVELNSPLATQVARSYPFTVTVRAPDDPATARQIQGEWTHIPLPLELELAPPQQTGSVAAFRLHIRNVGVAELALHLEATDPEGACLYRFERQDVTIPAGGDCSLALTVSARAPLAGEASVTHTFSVRARLAAAPQQVRQARGEWVQTAEVAQPSRPGCVFLLLWALATAVGGALGGIIGVVLNMVQPLALMGWAAAGVCIGLAQWLVLQGYARGSGAWAAVTAAGWAVAGPLSQVGGSVGWVIGAGVLAVLQFVVLQGKARSPGLWVPISLIAWGAGGVLAMALLAAGPAGPMEWILAWTVGSLVGGVATGPALLFMLRPKPSAMPADAAAK